MRLLNSSLLISILLIVSTQAQNGLRTTLSGGISKVTGINGKSFNSGVSAGIESGYNINNYFSFGGHIDYEWLTQKEPLDFPSDLNFLAGVHLWDASFVPIAYIPFSDKTNISFEIDPGFCLTYTYLCYDKIYTRTVFYTHFSLTTGVTLNLSHLALGVKYKRIFDSDGATANLICFNIGYVWRFTKSHTLEY